MSFCIAQYNQFLWEAMSIVSIMLFLTFWMIHRMSERHYPMMQMLSFGFALIASIFIWIKAKQVIPHYREEGLVDVVLLAAMVVILVDFIVYLLRASNVRISASREEFAIRLAVCLVAIYGIGLFMLGNEAHFKQLDDMVGMMLQPMWVVVIILMIVRFARGERMPRR